MRAESASGLRIDRTVAVEVGGLVGMPEQGEHRDGHVHARRHDSQGRLEVAGTLAEQQVGGHVEGELCARARIAGVVAGIGPRIGPGSGARVGERVEAGHDRDSALGLEVEAEPGHAVLGGVEAHAPILARALMPGDRRLGVQAFAQPSDPAAECGRRLARCPLEGECLELGRALGGQGGRDLEQRPHMRDRE